MFCSNRVLPSLRRTGVWREFLTGLLLATQLLLPVQAAAPSWWETRGVIIPGKASDDFAVINQGQLKYLVSAVVAEMNAKLTDGAGPSLNALVNAWTTSTAGADDFAVVNVGQLKTVTKAVHQRLLAAGAIEALPAWATDNGSDDFAVANIGQAKHLFAFEVPDQRITAPLTMHALYVQQAVVADHYSPFGIYVYFEQAGQAVPSVPVTFEVFQGQGGLVDYSNWGVGPQTTLGLQSDEYGYAGCQFKAGQDAGYSWVRASTAGGLSQWFLMITNGGGEEEFPTNPIGVSGIDFKKDSDEDGDSDVDEIAEGSDAKDASSYIPDWKFRSVNMKFQTQFDFWDTSNSPWLQPEGEQNWFTYRNKLIDGVSYNSGYELYGPLKPTLYDCPVLETFVKPTVNSSGWSTDAEQTVSWSDSFNFNPFYMEHYLEDEVRSIQARSGESNGYDDGQMIPGRNWVSSAVKLELRSSKPRPRSFTAMAVVERMRISYTEGSSGVTMDITTTVVDGFTLTLPAGAQTSESIVLSYPPELNCVDYYDVKYVPIEVREVWEQDQKWNKAPSPKRPAYANDIGISADQINNILFVAVEPQSEKAELVVKTSAPGSGVKLRCGIADVQSGDVLAESALVEPTGETELSFTPTGSVNDKLYRVVLGIDKNSDGILSNDEVVTNPLATKDSLFLRVVTSSDYQSAVDWMDWRDNTPGLYVARQFLRYFDGNNTTIDEGVVDTPITVQIIKGNPTHIAGSAYNTMDGSTQVECFKLPDGSTASNKMEDTFNRQDMGGLRSIIYNVWLNNVIALGEPFEQDSSLQTHTSQPLTIQNRAVISFYQQGMLDLNYSFGAAEMKSGTVVFELRRDTSDTTKVYLSSVSIDAVVEDLYDFDWTRAATSASRKGATVQIGWQPPQRKAGHIFFTNTELKKTYSNDGAIRNFNNYWHIKLVEPPSND